MKFEEGQKAVFEHGIDEGISYGEIKIYERGGGSIEAGVIREVESSDLKDSVRFLDEKLRPCGLVSVALNDTCPWIRKIIRLDHKSS
jgi:hypothetical protein